MRQPRRTKCKYRNFKPLTYACNSEITTFVFIKNKRQKMNTEELSELFRKHFKIDASAVTKLKGAGSNRQYFRLSNGDTTAIGVHGESAEENRSFIKLAEHFAAQGLPTPKVFCHTDDYMFYLQEDLGSIALFDAMENGVNTSSFSDAEKNLLFKTIEKLPDMQFKGAEGLDFSVCYPQSDFNRDTVMWDLNYFKYCYLKATGIQFLEPKLEDDFRKLADDLLAENTNTFLYRDFQSRNVMIKNGEPYFIDFQGGRRGPIYYDVASFVWQARANYHAPLKKELIKHYLDAISKYQSVDAAAFEKKLKLFVFFRTLQVLGAYGFRGYFEQKEHFIASIPFALNNLKESLNEGIADNYPYLKSVLVQLTETKDSEPEYPSENVDKLTVTVYSFSFKKGIPSDDSGNGGGYVFDCRGMNNPGRYDEYKQLTGLDKPVIDFLEERGEITRFLQSVYKIVDAHIVDYLKRGFANLSVCFGCTGGQHRSVYSAQHTAEHIAKKFGVKVRLIHRERGINQDFNF